jgi:hypothetical protein
MQALYKNHVSQSTKHEHGFERRKLCQLNGGREILATSSFGVKLYLMNKRNIRGDHCRMKFMAVAIRDWLTMYLDPGPLDREKYLLPALIYQIGMLITRMSTLSLDCRTCTKEIFLPILYSKSASVTMRLSYVSYD